MAKAKMTMSERIDQLEKMIEEDRVIRSSWRDTDAEGRERACLLTAMFPEVTNDAAQCPAGYLPLWFAYLTPSLDDNGSAFKWQSVCKEYARVVRVATPFTPWQWNVVRFAILDSLVRRLQTVPGDNFQKLLQKFVQFLESARNCLNLHVDTKHAVNEFSDTVMDEANGLGPSRIERHAMYAIHCACRALLNFDSLASSVSDAISHYGLSASAAVYAEHGMLDKAKIPSHIRAMSRIACTEFYDEITEALFKAIDETAKQPAGE